MSRSFYASEAGIKKAREAFKYSGKKQQFIADETKCSRATLSKFFNGKPIDKEIFQNICDFLKLDWREIAAELDSEEKLTPYANQKKQEFNTETVMISVENCTQEQKQESVIHILGLELKGQVIGNDKIEVNGNIKKIDDLVDEIKSCLKESSATIRYVTKGSIKINLEGSSENLKHLEVLLKSGKFTEVLGVPIENVQLEQITTEEDKSRIVKAIIDQKLIGKNLSGFDLSDVELSDLDLSGFDLSNANLTGADLNNTNLSNTNLRGANLFFARCCDVNLNGADLSGADLSGADLRNINLRRANLSNADLSGAILSNADLSGADLRNVKINEATELDNKWRLVWKIVNHGASGRNLSGATVIPEEISQFRSQLADYPQALVALDTIEECEGYLDDAVPLLVMRETAQEADRSLNDWLEKCRQFICQQEVREALESGLIAPIIEPLAASAGIPLSTATALIIWVFKLGAKKFCKVPESGASRPEAVNPSQ